MYYALVAVYVLVCLVLSLVILLQQGRGGDIASAFGGSSSQAAFGARSGATLLTKATSIAAVLFMLFALTLSVLGQRGGELGRERHSGSGACGQTGTVPPDRASVHGAALRRNRTRHPPKRTATRKWRNWQTHQLEGLAVAIPSGFKSPLPHSPVHYVMWAGPGTPLSCIDDFATRVVGESGATGYDGSRGQMGCTW